MSANDKLAATFHPGNETTPTLETRVAEVLAGHGQHDYRFNGGNWSDNCACGFKLFGIDYSPEHKTFPGMSYADCAFAAHQAAALAPVIAEAQAEAWERGLHVGIGYKSAMNLWGDTAPEPHNPYGSNDE